MPRFITPRLTMPRFIMSRLIMPRLTKSRLIMPRFWIIGATATLIASWSGAADDGGALLDFSEQERRAILQHGPWPQPWSPDPSNRASGSPEAIVLGERLFFDRRLSAQGTVSCASCHVPERGWTDGRKLAAGLAEVDRNTPTLLNVRNNRWFGWDGANDNLWSQSMRPMLDAREMGLTERRVADLVRNDRGYACRYEKIFGKAPSPTNDEAVVVEVGKALAAFQETLVSGRTAFDEFRDALERGDRKAAAAYPEEAQRGLRIFVGKGNCNLCHFGPGFTHGEFHEVGIPVFKKSGGLDWGRYEGIKKLKSSRFSLLGTYNDDPARAPGTSTRYVALLPQNFEQFKVPSLRNVALTAPYMHSGHLATLPDVVRHYSEINLQLLHVAHVYFDPLVPDAVPTDTLLKPLHLTQQEIADVVAFLMTLTDPAAGTPRKPVPDASTCRDG
jgi:cytochrome c peroxidase